MAKKDGSSSPTDSELAILQVLWRHGPSSVRTVWEILGQKSGYTTTLKLLQIMLEKKLVHRNENQATHLYSAGVAENAVQGQMVGKLVERAFGGSVTDLVLRALAAKPASADELRTIRQLLDQAEKQKKP